MTSDYRCRTHLARFTFSPQNSVRCNTAIVTASRSVLFLKIYQYFQLSVHHFFIIGGFFYFSLSVHLTGNNKAVCHKHSIRDLRTPHVVFQYTVSSTPSLVTNNMLMLIFRLGSVRAHIKN